MRNILAALLVGLIVVVTQSGSVIVIEVSSQRDLNSSSPAAVLPAPQPSAQHALLLTESNLPGVRPEPLLRGKVGPRRGPVK
jgi:hypothetical protein